ncbi:LysR family transcriptional regulator [Rhodobacteraceae bacterium RKSG542]|uniref:LysR family transcriptional regulator n=1 Tax=Pseudovibrio flavus TaxID=2529854 RepID=UPI0012BBD91C|nr:LysR family transcriptional regulator [Pseudovibrio flavus]MTI19093.1 LysR family transcriptional regulator [Pseudovibrio flavus]
MSSNRSLFQGLQVFAEVGRLGSFSAAADSLNHSPSHVSKEIVRLEERLGVRLVQRTTRSVRLTDEGRVFYERTQQLIEDAIYAQECVVNEAAEARGSLRVSVPVSFSHTHLNKVLPKFMRQHPHVRVDVNANDRFVDLVAEGVDVAIRIGALSNSNLIARRITTSRLMTVTSPAYLAEFGEPLEPKDLVHHRCVAYSNKAIPNIWDYFAPDGEALSVTVDPILHANNAETEVACAIDGIGLTQIPSFVVEEELEAGKLVPVLTGYEPAPTGIYAVYPHRTHLAAKTRAFVDFLIAEFSQENNVEREPA